MLTSSTVVGVRWLWQAEYVFFIAIQRRHLGMGRQQSDIHVRPAAVALTQPSSAYVVPGYVARPSVLHGFAITFQFTS